MANKARVIIEFDHEDLPFLTQFSTMVQLLKELSADDNYETWDNYGEIQCPYCLNHKQGDTPIKHDADCPIKRAKELLECGIRFPTKTKGGNCG